jgi:hypothetical protein
MKYLYIYILLIFIILYFSYHNSLENTINKEQFTPYFRRLYRPHLRNARLYTEGMYNKTNEYMSRFLRKTGLKK